MSVESNPYDLKSGLALPEILRDLRVFDSEGANVTLPLIDVPVGMMNREIVMRFVRAAEEYGISDLTVQSDDRVFASIRGRQVPLTARPLQSHQVRDFLALIGRSQVPLTALAAGEDWDDRFEEVVERGVRVGFRCNATKGRVGAAINDALSITMRTLPKLPPHISQIGLPPELMRAFFPTQGMVLVCGATGHGKSTTLAAVIATRQRYGLHQKTITFEAPSEFTYDGVDSPNNPKICQTDIPKDLPSFLRASRNMLRRAPVTIQLGEIRDLETLDASVLAAASGHGLYSTLHVETVHEAINRMITLYPLDAQTGAAFKIMRALRLIVVQRLLPTLDGKRLAVRSWLEFDEALKNELERLPVVDWSRFIRERVIELKQDFRHFAREAFLDGRISFAVLADEAALSPEERASERVALDALRAQRSLAEEATV
jgi:defect-in-organelle-trafficking protein DotB